MGVEGATGFEASTEAEGTTGLEDSTAAEETRALEGSAEVKETAGLEGSLEAAGTTGVEGSAESEGTTTTGLEGAEEPESKPSLLTRTSGVENEPPKGALLTGAAEAVLLEAGVQSKATE